MIPSKVKIGSTEWQVIYSDYLSDDQCHGKCYQEKHEIHIADSLTEEAKEETFIHELLHALCYFSGIQDEEKLDEEAICNRLGYILHSVLKENDISL